MNKQAIAPAVSISLHDTKTEMLCSTSHMLMTYLEKSRGKDGMEQAIRETGMSLDYIQNPRNWVSFEYYCRLLDKLIEVSGDPMAPFHAGTYASSRKCMGPIEILVTRATSVIGTYRFAIHLSPRWNKIAEWKMLHAKGNTCRISVRNFTYPQNKNNCLCIQGVLAAIVTLKGLPQAEIKEMQCACEGADSCVYDITWVHEPERTYAGPFSIAGLIAGIITGFMTAWAPVAWIVLSLAPLLGYFMGRDLDYKARLSEVHKQNEEQAKSLEESMRATEAFNIQLQHQVDERTKELRTANRQLSQTLDDLTKSREKALMAERQAAIGVLASATAHELNSPMNAIQLSNQSLREDIEKESPLHTQLGIIERAVSRCKRIINELLSFSRDPKKEPNVKINNIVETTVNLFKKERPAEIEVLKHISKNIPTLFLDGIQIQHAILNLLNNAADAMNNKGTIEISLQAEGESVVVRIKDNGPGMDKHVLENIFDPFFTTKKAQKGLGLGLSITYRLITRNGGTIDVVSEPGKGSEFILTFDANNTKDLET